MTVTLELKPETEKRLAKKAKENGLPIEDYLEVFIEDNLQDDVEAEEREKPFYETATKEEWIAEFDRWIESHRNENYPLIPDEALRRENMYEDRF